MLQKMKKNCAFVGLNMPKSASGDV